MLVWQETPKKEKGWPIQAVRILSPTTSTGADADIAPYDLVYGTCTD